MEIDYRHLFGEGKLGTTVWSPLASGFLTGKYNEGVPAESRLGKNPELKRFLDKYLNDSNREVNLKALNEMAAISKQLGCTMAQLAMAWVIKNPNVSTAITGASKVEQLEDTVKAVTVMKKLTAEIEKRLEDSFKTAPKGKMDMPKNHVHQSRRLT